MARFRVPDVVPLPGGVPAGEGSTYPKRRLPVASAILWTPAADNVALDSEFPVFIAQRALAAVHAQLVSKPRGTTSVGFLAGQLFQCSDTNVPYVVIESAIHLPWLISGDHLGPALSQGWAVVQEEVRKTGGQLLGWYHTHHAVEPKPSPADVETHLALFDQPWQVALVVSPGEGETLAGGFFRMSADGPGSAEYLPFYELLDAASLLPDGRKVSDLAWVNYRTEESILSSDRVSNPRAELQPQLLFPDDMEETAPLPASPVRRYGVQRTARFAGYGALGLLAAAGLFNVYRALASGPRAQLDGQPAAAVSPRERVDRMADTLALALAAFDLRARLLESRKMACPDLARGLVDLEERWTSYNLARKGDAAALDSARNGRDRALYSDVDAAERRFERSKCPRP